MAQVTLPFDVQPQEPAATRLEEKGGFLLGSLSWKKGIKREAFHETSQVKAKFSRRAGALSVCDIWTCCLGSQGFFEVLNKNWTKALLRFGLDGRYTLFVWQRCKIFFFEPN